MPSRGRNWIVVLGALGLGWLIQPFWNRNFEYAMEQRGWERALDMAIGAMPEWIGNAVAWFRLDGFWGGAFAVLAVWGCLEFIYAIQRSRPAKALQAPATASAKPQQSDRVFLPNSVSISDLTKSFQEHAEIDAEKMVSRYIGKWMTVRGTVKNIAETDSGGIYVTYEVPLFAMGSMVSLTFRGDQREVASVFARGVAITATGRVKRIDRFGVSLDDCEIKGGDIPDA